MRLNLLYRGRELHSKNNESRTLFEVRLLKKNPKYKFGHKKEKK